MIQTYINELINTVSLLFLPKSQLHPHNGLHILDAVTLPSNDFQRHLWKAVFYPCMFATSAFLREHPDNHLEGERVQKQDCDGKIKYNYTKTRRNQ